MRRFYLELQCSLMEISNVKSAFYSAFKKTNRIQSWYALTIWLSFSRVESRKGWRNGTNCLMKISGNTLMICKRLSSLREKDLINQISSKLCKRNSSLRSNLAKKRTSRTLSSKRYSHIIACMIRRTWLETWSEYIGNIFPYCFC